VQKPAIVVYQKRSLRRMQYVEKILKKNRNIKCKILNTKSTGDHKRLENKLVLINDTAGKNWYLIHSPKYFGLAN